MQRTPSNRQVSGLTFFITATLRNRLPLFGNVAAAKFAFEELQFFRAQGEIELYGYVIMPDHVHMIFKVIPPATLPRLLRRFKTQIAHDLNHGPIWQEGYWSEIIPDERMLLQKLTYIHENPIRANLVPKGSHYLWSSAREYDERSKSDLIDNWR